jgi:hypothetical protein
VAGAARGAKNVAVWFSINVTETVFLSSFACVVCSPLSQPCRVIPPHDEGGRITYFLKALLVLLGASAFEGEFRDGGFVQITFPECNKFLILIVGRLS